MKRGSAWTYVLYLGRDASGKKQQKWVGGHRSKKEAEDALVEALERMRGSVTDRSTSPIADSNDTRERWLPTIGVDG
jgi:hypothetical protein